MGPCCGLGGVECQACQCGGSGHRAGTCLCQLSSAVGGHSASGLCVPIPVSIKWLMWNCCCAGESDCLIETQLCEGTSWLVP